MRAAALAVAVVAAFVGVMYLRFSGDSVPGSPPGVAVGGPQCVVFRNVGDDTAQPTCGPATSRPTPASAPFGGAVIVVESPSPPPSAPVPAILSDMQVVPIQLGLPIDIPKDLALIVETG